MEIEQVQRRAVGQRQVGAQAPARLAVGDREVVVVRVRNGKAGEDGVAVRPLRQHQIRPVRHVPAEAAAEPAGVIGGLVAAIGFVRIADFLEGGHVAAHLLEQDGDAAEVVAAVDALAAVDVPGHEAHAAVSSASVLPLRSRKNRCRSCGRTTEAKAPSPSSSGWTMKVSTTSAESPPCEPNSNG